MSSEHSKAPRKARAISVEALEEEAASWLLRRSFFDWSDEDQQKLDAWLDESASHRVVYWRLNAALSRTERLAALRTTSRQPSPEKGRFRSGLIRAAAVFAFIVAGVVTSGVFYASRSGAETISTAIGGHKLVRLSDGSRIELNTNTIIRIARRGRAIELAQGEAYFEIRHDAARPFTVDVSGQRITDLGTKFLIRRSDDKVQVSLLEGRAQLAPQHAGPRVREAVLMPGDFATATAHTLSVEKISLQTLKNELGWRRGVLIFRNTTLAGRCE